MSQVKRGTPLLQRKGRDVYTGCMRKKVHAAKRSRKKFPFLPWILRLGFFALIAFFSFQWFANPHIPCGNSITCLGDLSGTISPDTTGVFMGKTVSIPQAVLAQAPIPKSVLGDQTGSDKHIYVDLTRQRLLAFEGSRQVYEFPVSSGKWYPTPTGDFRIWIKLRATRMSGGNPAAGTYYNLPNVPYVMFYANDTIAKSRGFSLHGTYWHNNFGHPMSHGCVNMRIEDARVIYNWANPVVTANTTYASEKDPGTPITIYGEAPVE